jgi:rod shape-determining protein MreD
MNAYKYLALVFSIVIAAVLQPTFFAKLFLPGATPDILIVVLTSWALLKGPAVGAIAGFVTGFLIDVLPPGDHLMGISSIFLTIIGYLVGYMSQNQSRSIARPLIISASVANIFLIARSIWANISGSEFSLNIFAVNFLTQGIYAALLAVFIYPAIALLDKKLGPISRAEELRV